MFDDPPATVELFCQRHVEPMAEESDNIHIAALTDALQARQQVSLITSQATCHRQLMGGLF